MGIWHVPTCHVLALVRTAQPHGASFEDGLNSVFVTAGAVTLAGAVFTGLRLAKVTPADVSNRAQTIRWAHSLIDG